MERILLDIFVQGIWAGSIIPFADQNKLFALFSFKSDIGAYAVAAAVVGNMLGFTFNWYLGHLISRFARKKKPEPHLVADELMGPEIRMPMQKYGWIALLFVWVPLGNFLTIVAGALNIRLDKTILVAGFAMALYYVYQSGLLS